MRTVLALLLLCTSAAAHEWYDYSCCSDRDCGPIPFDRVKTLADGYHIFFPSGREEVVPYGDRRIKATPPEDPEQRYHLCTVAGREDGMILCLYVPQGGA